MKLSKILGALLVCALFCAPALAQDVTILDFGSDTANNGANTAYTEVVEAGDGTPLVANAAAPDVENPTQFGPFALAGGATISWTDVTSWNNQIGDSTAGQNYFAHQTALDGTNPTTFTITTANPTDTVLIEAVGGFSRDALLSYDGGAEVNIGRYDPLDQSGLGATTTGWQVVGTSTGSATGTLATGTAGDEGNVGAFRVTITSAVPEPTSVALFGLAGMMGLVVRRRN